MQVNCSQCGQLIDEAIMKKRTVVVTNIKGDNQDESPALWANRVFRRIWFAGLFTGFLIAIAFLSFIAFLVGLGR